jgi:hypothetical protein
MNVLVDEIADDGASAHPEGVDLTKEFGAEVGPQQVRGS